MSLQTDYKSRKVRERKKVDEVPVKRLVEAEREVWPRVGGLKRHRMLREKLESEQVYLGRDLFFEVLRNQALLLEALPKASRTTNSRHGLPVFSNLVKELELSGGRPERANQVTEGHQ